MFVMPPLCPPGTIFPREFGLVCWGLDSADEEVHSEATGTRTYSGIKLCQINILVHFIYY